MAKMGKPQGKKEYWENQIVINLELEKKRFVKTSLLKEKYFSINLSISFGNNNQYGLGKIIISDYNLLFI